MDLGPKIFRASLIFFYEQKSSILQIWVKASNFIKKNFRPDLSTLY